jgi:predicted nucleic acid-binding protein
MTELTHAYVDTSALVAATFGGAPKVVLEVLLKAHLFVGTVGEAELASVYRREGRKPEELRELQRSWSLVTPRESLLPQLQRVLDTGYLRGADAWHVACALWLTPDPGALYFVTLDLAQARVARMLGLNVVSE